MPTLTPPNEWVFQSTHPARGATRPSSIGRTVPGYFNPRTPRGVRHDLYQIASDAVKISIHAPREGCDLMEKQKQDIMSISIHAPREGCDRMPQPPFQRQTYFNPRTPRGVRLFSY